MKRRTGLLFSSAVALGLVGGAAGGFAVQHARPATPLPPVPRTVALAAGPGAAETPDPKTDDGAKLDGDLRAVLMAPPAGTYGDPLVPSGQWVTIGRLAEYFARPDKELAALNAEGFRRATRNVWLKEDGTRVEVDLVQFRSTEGAGQFFADTQDQMNANSPVAGVTGTAFVGQGYTAMKDGRYAGYGLVLHGTVVEQLFIYRPKLAPSIDDLTYVVKGQADRL
ncbi:MAG: hypothetical protein HOW97_17305 [Catenulispora sp.]|nr:hypothetical protein [Catenulispora sp.]